MHNNYCTDEQKPNSGSWIGSRGHQKILPKSSGRPDRDRKGSTRKHRRNRSTESLASGSGDSKPSPVVITTVLNRKASTDSKDTRGGAVAAAPSASSAASVDSGSQAGGASGSTTGTDRNSLRTIAQQRTPSASEARGAAAARLASRAAGTGAGAGGGFSSGPPKLTINTDDFAVRVPAQGSSIRSELAKGLSPAGSQTSSVVTRVYAPSSVDEQASFSRGGASWAMEVCVWVVDGSRERGREGKEAEVVMVAAFGVVVWPGRANGVRRGCA